MKHSLVFVCLCSVLFIGSDKGAEKGAEFAKKEAALQKRIDAPESKLPALEKKDDLQKRIDAPESKLPVLEKRDDLQRHVDEIEKRLKRLESAEFTGSKFMVWKTLCLDFGPKTADEFIDMASKKSNELYLFEHDAFRKAFSDRFYFSGLKERQAYLTRVTRRNLHALPNNDLNTNWNTVLNRAQAEGLEFCPPDMGLRLRMQYDDQPEDQPVIMGMIPMTGEYQPSTHHSPQLVFILSQVGKISKLETLDLLDVSNWKKIDTLLWVFIMPVPR